MNKPRRTATSQPVLKMDPEAMRNHATDAAQLLRALANDKRLMLLCLLVEGEHSVSELNAKVKPVSYTHLDVYKRQLLPWCPARAAHQVLVNSPAH